MSYKQTFVSTAQIAEWGFQLHVYSACSSSESVPRSVGYVLILHRAIVVPRLRVISLLSANMSVAIWGVRLWSTRLVVAVLLVTVSLTEGTEILVGGTKGWTTGFDYDAWASSQNIQPRVGDSLVFMNRDQLTHTVGLLGDADSYQRCVLGGVANVTPVPAGKNFTFVIPASLVGSTVYAVCTIPGHCTDMQKIKGTVLAALGATNATAPPSPASSGTQTADADMNRLICWTTVILLITACF